MLEEGGYRKPSFAIFDPTTNYFRICILLGACFLTFGSYWSYDIVGALSPILLDPFYDITSGQESLLYSVYSLPNTVLPFFGGILVDKYLGVRFGGILFGSLVLIGQLLWATSCFFPTSGGFYLAVLGRFIFGLGGESLSVTQSAYCGKWFDKNQLGTAFGITLAFARIGSAINFVVTPFLGDISVGLAVWAGFLACFVSIIFAFQLAFWDWRGESVKPVDEVEAEVIRFSDILHFPYTLWMLIGVCVLFYVSIFVWLQYAVAFFVQDYGIDSTTAGLIVSIPYWVAAVAAPTFGVIIDRVGFVLVWLSFACFLNCFCMLSMLFIHAIPPIVPMFFVGVSYSMVAASLWPCIPLIVPPKALGTAYGLFFAIQNMGLFVAPLVVGHITSTGFYTTMMLTFAECAGLAGCIAVSVAVCDFVTNRQINMSARAMKAKAAAAASLQEDNALVKKTMSVNDENFDRFNLQDQYD